MNPPPTTTAKTERHHDIDALRVLAFGLLIFYHIGMFYVADWGWHVKSAYQSETLQALMILVNQWRMPLLFMISGMAVHFLTDKVSAGRFAWMRSWRLLVPLAFGMLVVVPPQAYFQGLSNGAVEPGYVGFLARYYTFQPWPEGAFDGWQFGVTWNHLWYLPYLWCYTMVIAVLLGLFRTRPGQQIITWIQNMEGWQVYVIPAIPFLIYAWTIRGRFPITHSLFDDWYAHAVYLTIFIFGFLLGRSLSLWAELARLRWLSLTMAIISYITLMTAFELLGENPGQLAITATRGLIVFNSWFWITSVLGWGHHALNQPMRWLSYANEAVFSWYILHQTITVTAGFYLSRLTLGPVLEPILVIALTLLGTLGLHELVIRRTSWLRPLFGLKRPT